MATTTTVKPFRELLAEIQKLEGYQGDQIGFARHLGITQPHLSRILRGERGIGAALAFKLIERYPHLYEPIKRSFAVSNMQQVILRDE
jgi:plasmid maintenance system antidote protein VapI